ncbi:ABC transporter ATP-binding protein [Alkalisalibacterium limincola]|uniref:ABC transporter ATP-binding protein n=1 Tax=Alkalisalibacterium limincola TaxID=2699169 RepID=A0A5C8KQ10_9GAMM|nr:ABC transporter ATP-binding protein [Alkalisalibacterium limincola]TXK62349.1 ABC transporter ATP-binding protein [Alkalisalibacterium limincola]
MLRVHLQSRGPIPLAVGFDVAPGELLALVGPSGSGKSTILRCIAGLWAAASGRIEVGGECWLDSARGIGVVAHQRRVGMVFQSYALFPHLSATGNVRAAMTHVPRADRAARAEALLSMVNLSGLGGRRPAELSGGQQQRVALARALAREPRALLLDEPFSAVDRATRERLYREIAELRRRLTMPAVLVTHDMDEAARLADRMLVVHHGEGLQLGTPLEVTTRPDSPVVARLVGLRNVFEGRVAQAGVLDWQGLRLEADTTGFASGDGVHWVLPDGFAVLHRRDRPSRGEHENPLPGRIGECLVMGQTAHLTLRPDHAPGQSLHFSLPLHVVQRNGIEVGAQVSVSMLVEGIHCMRGSRSQ